MWERMDSYHTPKSNQLYERPKCKAQNHNALVSIFIISLKSEAAKPSRQYHTKPKASKSKDRFLGILDTCLPSVFLGRCSSAMGSLFIFWRLKGEKFLFWLNLTYL